MRMHSKNIFFKCLIFSHNLYGTDISC